jgi:hypothetical protein
MSRKYLAALTAVAAMAALAFAASATSSATKAHAQPATKLAAGTTQVGSLSVRFTVKRFVRRGSKLYAVGSTITRFNPTAANPQNLPTKAVRKAFTARVAKLKLKRVHSAQRICPVLDLTLAPVDLSLLGLMVHLDRVHLSITANSNGGLLGQLLCAVSGRFTPLQIVQKWTQAAQQSGLATKGVQVSVPLNQTTSGSGSTGLNSASTASPLAICNVLELTLGPLDLNLLGLMVHLDTVHLVITADSEGGILGSLLCSLAGGGTPATG